MKIAMLIPDNRDEFKTHSDQEPRFGPAPAALLEGFAQLTECEVHVICCTHRALRSPTKLAANIWYHSLVVPRWGWRAAYLGCVWALRKKLRELQPEVVHGQGTERYCALAAALSGFPNVITIHGNMGAVARAISARIGSFAWCAAQLENFTLPRTNGVLCNSRYTEELVQRRNSRTWLVSNALRLPFFETPLPPRSAPARPIVLNIGTVTPYKRQLELLLLADQLHRANLCFEMQFIGGADTRSPYSRLFLERVAKAEKKGFARHLGFLSLQELIAKLDSSWGLVHAPSEEAFGLVVAEALARNLKFFGTTAGGVPDIAAGVEGAELFGPEEESSLQEAIARWLRTDAPRPLTAAAEMRRRYHPEVIAAQHLEIYRSLLNEA